MHIHNFLPSGESVSCIDEFGASDIVVNITVDQVVAVNIAVVVRGVVGRVAPKTISVHFYGSSKVPV